MEIAALMVVLAWFGIVGSWAADEVWIGLAGLGRNRTCH